MNVLNDHEVPVAKSVMQWFGRNSFLRTDGDIFIKYIMLWIAFNNIYVTLVNQKNIRRKPVENKNNSPLKPFMRGSIIMTKMSRVTEREQINVAFKLFSNDLKELLIQHENTKFFVYRVPKWHDKEIEFDKNGQRVNGVIDLGHTYNEDYLNWSPIDIQKYEEYKKGIVSAETRDDLAEQILDLLYTIRNNTFHGGKRFDDENSREVIIKAIPLLNLIVESFYPFQKMHH